MHKIEMVKLGASKGSYIFDVIPVFFNFDFFNQNCDLKVYVIVKKCKKLQKILGKCSRIKLIK
jgi:hypothetical protein